MLILYVIIKMLFEIKSGVIDMSLKQRKKEVACLKFDYLSIVFLTPKHLFQKGWQPIDKKDQLSSDHFGIMGLDIMLACYSSLNSLIISFMQLDKLTTVFSVAAICAMNLMLTAQDYHHHDPHTSFFLLQEALHVTLKECKYQMARHLEKSLFNMTLNVTHFIVLLTLAATLAHAFVTYIFANQLPTVIYSHYL